jgi:hypothetical protein
MCEVRILNGPDIGRSFQLKEDGTTIGRSKENDVQIKDKTLSRVHLRIARRGGRYFLTDLGSQNGTFYDGKYLIPGVEVEAKEGVPIALGMTIVGIGETFLAQKLPFLDSVGLTRDMWEDSGVYLFDKDKTNQKKLEFVYNVSDLLMQNLPVKETLEGILDLILELLVRIDRAAFFLIDPEVEKVNQFISRLKIHQSQATLDYPIDVVNRVIRKKEAIIVSDSQGGEVDDDLATTLKLKKIFSLVCVPLMAFSQLFGAVYLDSMTQRYGFRREDLALFQDIAQRTAAFLLHD